MVQTNRSKLSNCIPLAHHEDHPRGMRNYRGSDFADTCRPNTILRPKKNKKITSWQNLENEGKCK